MDEVAADYKTALKDLAFNSKPMITMLTMLADENKDAAAPIVKVIDEHIRETSYKLPSLYLIDSIVKNVGVEYKRKFSYIIPKIFSTTFKMVDEKTRKKMYELRQTWNEVFPKSQLFLLDTCVHDIDPAWPITSQPQLGQSSNPKPSTIHVNPNKFSPQAIQNAVPIKGSTSSTSHSKSSQAIEELKRLQHEKKELEETRKRVEKLMKEKDRLDSTKLTPSHKPPDSLDREQFLRKYKIKKKEPRVEEYRSKKGSNIHVAPWKAKDLSLLPETVEKSSKKAVESAVEAARKFLAVPSRGSRELRLAKESATPGSRMAKETPTPASLVIRDTSAPRVAKDKSTQPARIVKEVTPTIVPIKENSRDPRLRKNRDVLFQSDPFANKIDGLKETIGDKEKKDGKEKLEIFDKPKEKVKIDFGDLLTVFDKQQDENEKKKDKVDKTDKPDLIKDIKKKEVKKLEETLEKSPTKVDRKSRLEKAREFVSKDAEKEMNKKNLEKNKLFESLKRDRNKVVDKSPDKKLKSPEKRSKSPDKRSKSPDRKSRSLDKRSKSPINWQKSPDHRTISPVQSVKLPVQRSKSPVQISESPDYFTKVMDQLSISPKKQSKSPNQIKKSPERRSKSPDTLNKFPDTLNKSPDKRSKSPDTLSKSPDKRSKSPDPLNKSPNKPSKSPDSLNKSPDKPSKSPDPLNKLLDKPSKSPDTLNKSPDKPSKSPDTLNKSPHMRSKSPTHRSKSPDQQKKFLEEKNKITLKRSKFPEQRSKSPAQEFLDKQLESPTRRSKSPDKLDESPDKQPNSPAKGSKSPPRRNKSPDERNKSSSRRSKSPDKRSKSPSWRGNSPDKRSKSPTHQSKSPDHLSKFPNKRSISPDKFNKFSDKRSKSPDKQSKFPDGRNKSPQHKSISPESNYVRKSKIVDKRYAISPVQKNTNEEKLIKYPDNREKEMKDSDFRVKIRERLKRDKNSSKELLEESYRKEEKFYHKQNFPKDEKFKSKKTDNATSTDEKSSKPAKLSAVSDISDSDEPMDVDKEPDDIDSPSSKKSDSFASGSVKTMSMADTIKLITKHQKQVPKRNDLESNRNGARTIGPVRSRIKGKFRETEKNRDFEKARDIDRRDTMRIREVDRFRDNERSRNRGKFRYSDKIRDLKNNFENERNRDKEKARDTDRRNSGSKRKNSETKIVSYSPCSSPELTDTEPENNGNVEIHDGKKDQDDRTIEKLPPADALMAIIETKKAEDVDLRLLHNKPDAVEKKKSDTLFGTKDVDLRQLTMPPQFAAKQQQQQQQKEIPLGVTPDEDLRNLGPERPAPAETPSRRLNRPHAAKWEKFRDSNPEFKEYERKASIAEDFAPQVFTDNGEGPKTMTIWDRPCPGSERPRRRRSFGPGVPPGIMGARPAENWSSNRDLPTIPEDILRLICHDSETRTIDIDAKPREIRTYGEVAIILMDWDDPRFLSFEKNIECNIIFDNGAFVLPMKVGEDYRDVNIDGQVHRIKLGVPTQELMINGKGYQCFFGGKPISVHLTGKNRLISLDGRPPRVDIGPKNIEYLAGRTDLHISDKKIVPLYLDAKPQKVTIEGMPIVIRFIDKFLGVLINNVKFQVHFNGNPIQISVRGVQQVLKFTVLPIHVIAGTTIVKGMDRPDNMIMPSFNSDSPPVTQQSEIISYMSPSVPVGPRGPRPGGPGVQDPRFGFAGPRAPPIRPLPFGVIPDVSAQNFGPMRPIIPGAYQSGSGPPPHPNMGPPLRPNMGPPHNLNIPPQHVNIVRPTLPGFPGPPGFQPNQPPFQPNQPGFPPNQPRFPPNQPAPVPTQPSIDVKTLLDRLVKTGIIGSGSGSSEEKTPEKAVEPATVTGKKKKSHRRKSNRSETELSDQDDMQDVPAVDVMFNLDNLRKRNDRMIRNMHSGLQCSSCGLRYPARERDLYSKHLDWHFRKNKKQQDSTKRVSTRHLYFTFSDWILYEEVEDYELRVPSMFESQNADRDLEEEEIPSVAVEDHEISTDVDDTESPLDVDLGVCPVCLETFDQFWNQNTDSWHYKYAVNQEGANFHPSCYKDMVKLRDKEAALLKAENEEQIAENEVQIEEDGEKTQEKEKTPINPEEIIIDEDEEMNTETIEIEKKEGDNSEKEKENKNVEDKNIDKVKETEVDKTGDRSKISDTEKTKEADQSVIEESVEETNQKEKENSISEGIEIIEKDKEAELEIPLVFIQSEIKEKEKLETKISEDDSEIKEVADEEIQEIEKVIDDTPKLEIDLTQEADEMTPDELPPPLPSRKRRRTISDKENIPENVGPIKVRIKEETKESDGEMRVFICPRLPPILSDLPIKVELEEEPLVVIDDDPLLDNDIGIIPEIGWSKEPTARSLTDTASSIDGNTEPALPPSSSQNNSLAPRIRINFTNIVRNTPDRENSQNGDSNPSQENGMDFSEEPEWTVDLNLKPLFRDVLLDKQPVAHRGMELSSLCSIM